MKVTIFFMSLVVGLTAFAQNTKATPQQRTALDGTVFTRDTSHPELGEAYKDPSTGIIWGEVASVGFVYLGPAERNCKELGARLPKLHEFLDVARHFRKESDGTYDPYLTDGSEGVLPKFPNYYFWMDPEGSQGSPLGFDGSKGKIAFSEYGGLAVFRCVVGP